MRDDEAIGMAATALAVATLVIGGGWAAWWLAARFSGAPPVPGGPPSMLKALVRHEAAWPPAATWWAAALGVVLVIGVVVIVVRMPSRLDQAARRLPRDAGLGRYVKGTGPTIGRVVGGGRRVVRMTEEDQATVVAGPRTGKTTSIAIPAALAHRGPLLITSNKRDVVDSTTTARAAEGRVWLFDPQGLAGGGAATWAWNPLTVAGTVRGADRLAGIWATASKAPDARPDAYFDPEGQTLLTGMLLAASTKGFDLTQVYRWLAAPDDPSPVDLLSTVEGAELVSADLSRIQGLPDRQRAGVYATAAKAMAWLGTPEIRAWVDVDGHEQFDPTGFVRSTDTLVSLSREGQGSAAPLVTALTAAVLEAAERQATREPAGRLATPLLGVLDEAANVCRWRELPDLYSHYGSRGILLISIFQSWAQMVEAFRPHGAEKLWSASNVRVYAGGVADTTFLRRLSDLAGEHDAQVYSSSTSRQGGSRSRSTHRRAIFDVAQLAAMPPGRALVLLSAARPVLAELTPWYRTKAGKRIQAAARTTP